MCLYVCIKHLQTDLTHLQGIISKPLKNTYYISASCDWGERCTNVVIVKMVTAQCKTLKPTMSLSLMLF